jgi:hypothetical protein
MAIDKGGPLVVKAIIAGGLLAAGYVLGKGSDNQIGYNPNQTPQIPDYGNSNWNGNGNGYSNYENSSPENGGQNVL